MSGYSMPLFLQNIRKLIYHNKTIYLNCDIYILVKNKDPKKIINLNS